MWWGSEVPVEDSRNDAYHLTEQQLYRLTAESGVIYFSGQKQQHKRFGFALLQHQTFIRSIINVASGLARRGSSLRVFHVLIHILKNLLAKQDETNGSDQSGSLLIASRRL